MNNSLIVYFREAFSYLPYDGQVFGTECEVSFSKVGSVDMF